jgi:hypothetical protein
LAIRLAIYCADDADTDRYEVARYRSLWASTRAASLSSAITHPAAPAESPGTPAWVITILVRLSI